jgi:hypothetical protein
MESAVDSEYLRNDLGKLSSDPQATSLIFSGRFHRLKGSTDIMTLNLAFSNIVAASMEIEWKTIESLPQISRFL